MKIGIVSDGKFGDRAFEIIGERFLVEWIAVPFPGSPVVDDVELDLPECDLYISYARHPDIALAVIEKGVPTILGISFGPGFLRQAREKNEQVVAPITMCSLEEGTGSETIDTFARAFGRPAFDLDIRDGRIIRAGVVRGSPCGSTRAAAEVIGEPIAPETLRHFGLRICHFCRAPRFGRTCDKELSGLLHIRELVRAVLQSPEPVRERISEFAAEIEALCEEREKQVSAV
ncbi:hypothetical protein ASZ90_009490 [hydrocarbon metagenome]|uniref:Thymidylate synthase n=1 Tax=hydrocarbon metagenome TaxID=938273 RepID=A0A0W8FIN3_9ZZZZ